MKKHEENNSMKQEEKNSSAEVNEKSTLTGEQSLPDAENAESTVEAKLEVELSAIKDKYLRLYSDFENYKKRITRERIESSKNAGAEMLLSVLPIVDDMERAVKAMNETANDKTVKEGMKLIFSKLIAMTESKGLKPMESIGKTFDPDLHDAISQVPSTSDDMKGKVIDEIEKGYFLNDKVIRHAKVIVGF